MNMKLKLAENVDGYIKQLSEGLKLPREVVIDRMLTAHLAFRYAMEKEGKGAPEYHYEFVGDADGKLLPHAETFDFLVGKYRAMLRGWN